MCYSVRSIFTFLHGRRLIMTIALFGFIPFPLVGCGGGDPDYESCTTVSGKTYCCRTYCNSDGKSCKTTCD
jgi:hypothetical protein